MSCFLFSNALLVLSLFFKYTSSISPPSFVQPCSVKDSVCLRKSAQDSLAKFVEGLPEYGIDKMDPMTVDKLKISAIGLHGAVQNASITGMKKAIIDDVSINLDDKFLELTFHTDLKVKSKYVIGGRVLLLPVHGEGDARVKINKFKFHAKCQFNLTTLQSGEVQYKAADDCKFDYSVLQDANFVFTNLFDGNKELADTMLQLMNDNWQLMFNEVAPPIVDLLASRIIQNLKIFFESTPFNELVKL